MTTDLSRRKLLQLATSSLIVAACSPTAPSVAAPAATGAPKPRRGGVLVKYTIKESETLDPVKESSATVFMQLAQLYSGLVRFDPDDGVTIVPDLAKEWQITSAGTTYTFLLRDDVKFHNGARMTPEDVVFSLRRAKGDFGVQLRSPKAGADLAAIVESVVVSGPNTVQIRTKRASATFLPLLASPLVAIVPEGPLRAKKDMYFTDDPIGTGPFKLKEWKRGQYYDFERFDDYVTSYRPAEKLPYIDGVRTLVIPGEAAWFSGLLGGQLDVTPRFPSLSVKQGDLLKERRGDGIVISRIPDLSIVVTEMSTVKEPFKSNLKLRQAVWFAIDRKEIAEKVYEGRLKPGYLVDPAVSPTASLRSEDLAALSCYSSPCLDRAKALVAEAGIPAGTPIDVESSNAPEQIAIGEILAQRLREIGLNAKYSVQEGAAWTARFRAGDFHIFSAVVPAARFPSPLENLEVFKTGSGTNFARWSDAEVDSLLNRASGTLDPAQFGQAAVEAQRRIVQGTSGAIIPLGVGEGIFAHSSRLKGFRFNPTAYESWRLDTAWLES